MVNIVGKDNSVVKQITCKGCASILEYTQVEVKSVHSTDYSGGADGHEYIDCPCCGKKVIIRAW